MLNGQRQELENRGASRKGLANGFTKLKLMGACQDKMAVCPFLVHDGLDVAEQRGHTACAAALGLMLLGVAIALC